MLSDLPPDQAEQVEAHLEQCPTCRKEARLTQEVVEGLERLRKTPPAWAMAEARRRYLEDPTPRIKPPRERWRWPW